jgi:hypothetical protein
LLKHGYSNFKLEILEYCDKEHLIQREQYYIDVLKPEYNILKVAGSTLGFKHSTKTLLKFKNRDLGLGKTLTVTDKIGDVITEYPSVRNAAKSLNVSHPTILDYCNRNLLLKKRYLISNYKPKLVIEDFKYKVYNTVDNSTKEFCTLRDISLYIGNYYNIILSVSTVSNYIKSGKRYKNEFNIFKIVK